MVDTAVVAGRKTPSPRGGCVREGVCVRGDGCPGGVCVGGGGCFTPVDRMTDACENITFPQLLLRTVIKIVTRRCYDRVSMLKVALCA